MLVGEGEDVVRGTSHEFWRQQVRTYTGPADGDQVCQDLYEVCPR